MHTTDSNHDLSIAGNLLNRQFEPEAVNKACVADIAYIRTRSGWLYLAVVLDLVSRKIVGWSMAPNMPAELVRSATGSCPVSTATWSDRSLGSVARRELHGAADKK